MPKTKAVSPARSQGGIPTPKRKSTRGSRSLCSPALSTASGRLTSLIDQFKDKNMESFALSPLNGRSVLNDNTEIEEPKRKSWWKKLDENSQDVMEVLEDNKVIINNAIEEFVDIEVLSQEKKNYTLDLPESSDNESINSIVLPQRRLFTQKEHQPQKNFGHLIDNRESLAKLPKTNTTNIDKSVNVGTRELFRNAKRSKPIFPAALLNISPNKTAADKTKENILAHPKPQVRNIFGNRPANKRKNMFADFIVSESEDEISEIQPKVFGFQKKLEQRRFSSASKGRDPSPSSSITTDIEMDFRNMLPSSTMVENQLEEMMVSTPVKRTRLSKLSEAKESEAGTNTLQTNSTVSDKTKQSNKSASSKNKSKSSPEIREKSLNSSRTTRSMLKTTSIHEKEDAKTIKSQNKSKGNDLNVSPKSDKDKRNTTLNKSQAQNKSRTRNSSRAMETEIDSEEISSTNKSLQKIEKVVKTVEESVESQTEQHSVHDNIDGVQDQVILSKILIKETEQNNDEEMVDQEINSREDNDEKIEHENEEDVRISQKIDEQANENEQNEDELNVSQENEEKQNESEDVAMESQEIENEENEGEEDEEEGNESDNNEDEASESHEVEAEVNESQEIEEDANESQEVETEANESQEIEKDANESQEVAAEEIETEEIEEDANKSQEVAEEKNENQEIEEDVNESQEEAAEENESREMEENANESQEIEREADVNHDVEKKGNESQENAEAAVDEVNAEESEEDLLPNFRYESDEADKAIASDPEISDDNQANEMEVDDDEDEDQESENESEQNEHESHEERQIEEQNEIEPSKEIEESPNVTHDTTGRHRKKHLNKSPEVILHDKTNQMDSFTAKGRNTSVRKTKSMISKTLNIRPSLAPHRDSTGLSDGTKNSSAEGSGWDSHRTTRKTLRQTFGKDFTPRKSLRALVMEKSAKRQTEHTEMHSETVKFPLANSTEMPEDSNHYVEDVVQSDHEVSRQTRLTALEMALQKIKEQNIEKRLKLEAAVRNSLKNPPTNSLSLFKVPNKPAPRRLKPSQMKPKKQLKSLIPLDELPVEVIQDMKYKPPKRFRPSNASWITKRLYKFLEDKLEAKYDYKARVRAEKLAETIYNFTKDLRRHNVAPSDAVEVLKHEFARLDIVRTHFEFYEFFHEFMPREVRIKVVPDIVNKIPLPRHGVFSDILRD